MFYSMSYLLDVKTRETADKTRVTERIQNKKESLPSANPAEKGVITVAP